MNTNQHYNKLSPEAFRMLSELDSRDNPTATVLMSINGMITDDRRTMIHTMGGRIRTEAGNVVTMDIPAQKLLDLAGLEFTRYLEVSRSLHQEQEHHNYIDIEVTGDNHEQD